MGSSPLKKSAIKKTFDITIEPPDLIPDSLPEGTEKTLCKLITKFQDPTLKKLSQQQQKEVEEEFETLEKQVIKENFNEKVISLKIKDCRKNLSNPAYLSVINENLNTILHNNVQILSVEKFYQITKEAIYKSDSLKNKEVVLFIGEIGCGKSSMILYLFGCKLTVKNDTFILAGSNIKNIHGLNQIKLYSKQGSGTKYVTSVKLTSEQDPKTKNLGPSLLICDTPGYGDKKGSEIEIANYIGISKAIAESLTVKIISVFSQQSIGEKCEGVRKMYNFINNIFPSFTKEYLESFLFAFTNFDKKAGLNLKNKLMDFNSLVRKQEPKNQNLMDLIQKMLENLKNFNPINPLKDKSKKRVSLIKAIHSLKPIENPKKLVNSSLPEEFKRIFMKYINIKELNIPNFCKDRDYANVKKILENLKTLSELSELKNFNDYYEEFSKTVIEYIKKDHEESIDSLNRIFSEDKSPMRSEQFEDYKILLDKTKEFEDFRINHLKKSSATVNLEKAVRDNVEGMKNSLSGLTFSIKNEKFKKICRDVEVLKKSFQICGTYYMIIDGLVPY